MDFNAAAAAAADDDDDAFNDTVFELQASLVTMQAEVTQYQKQSQQQQATIRQLQNEISQANLQRQLMQEKLQKQQQQQTTLAWQQHSSAPPLAPPPPPSPIQESQQKPPETVQEKNRSVSCSPSKPTDAIQIESQDVHSTTTETTSLGMFLCRSVLVDKNESGGSPSPSGGKITRIIWQKIQPTQDVSLLLFLLEYSQAYLLLEQKQYAAVDEEATSDSPLPWLFYALVFAQGRAMATTNSTAAATTAASQQSSTTTSSRPLRLRVVNTAHPPPLQQQRPRSPRAPLLQAIPSLLLQKTLHAVAAYGCALLRRQQQVGDSRVPLSHAQEDLLYVFRILALPLAATIDWNTGNDQDYEDFDTLLWTWITNGLHQHVTAPPQAPRRYDSPTRSVDGLPIAMQHLIAALHLGRLRCGSGDNTATTSQPWIRPLVAVTSDWVHFVLLPCFALYRPHNQPDETFLVETTDDSTTTKITMDQRASLACELVQCWQCLFGVDSDWLRTQLALCNSADQALSSSSAGRTHASSMLQLACRLLQAIALEEPNNQLQKSFRGLQECLLRFLGPIVARHGTWLDTSSHLSYTSALAHLKAQTPSEDGLLIQACWDGVREDPTGVE